MKKLQVANFKTLRLIFLTNLEFLATLRYYNLNYKLL